MIPLRLQLKNFLSYGGEIQEIDFSTYNLICLSGKNGHGKSALLDAMTWAVWGQARKTTGTSKPDHGLLRLGQRNMKVIFDFEFNNNCYRVRREFTFAYGKPSTYLEFGILDKDTDEIVPLTDKTIRKTQDKIELLIGLDYDSFTNSAFIRQGNSGEFSHKSPKERKEILAAILGLNKYDDLRKLASEKSRAADSERQSLLKLQERLEGEIALKDELSQKQKNLKEELSQAIKEEKSLDKNLSNKKTDLQKTLLICEQRRQKQQEHDELLKLHKIDTSRLQALRAEWQKVIIVLTGELDYQLLVEKQVVLNKKLDNLRLQQQKALKVKEELVVLQGDLQKSEQIQNLLIKLANELKLISEQLQKVDEKLLKHKNLLLEYEDKNKKFEDHKEYYHQLIALGNSAKQELVDLRRKQSSICGDDSSCPLCEQNLPQERKENLSSGFASQVEVLNVRIDKTGSTLKDLKATILKEHKEVEDLRKLLADQKVWQSQQEQLQQRSKLLIDEQKKLLDGVTTDDLKKSHYNLVVKVKQQEVDLHVIKYHPEQQVNLEKQLQEVNGKLQLGKDDAASLSERRSSILQSVAILVQQLKQQKNKLQELGAYLVEHKDIDMQSKQQKLEAKQLEDDLKKLKKIKETFLKEQGSLQQQLDKLVLLQKEFVSLQKNVNSLEEQIEDYKALTVAFGKDGIQALLIEEAIPEIEQEANHLLGRLTDNQAQLFIESLRDLKKGGAKETLDIKISDSAGIRPYEMFSGGEAFRIDFALRIAISKLLVRRAGTSLQTLIIDEGFGSQDEEGLSHIMDAIYKIQEDFAKIIIVSHLPSMKDSFPVHFFVQKGAAGSHVTVMEQG